jgi:hypothetical protein
MWDPQVVARVEETAESVIRQYRDDPRLMGYYSDNELGWWNAALLEHTFRQPSTSGQRRRLIELLRDEYHDDWTLLTRDFDPEGAEGFSELAEKGRLYLRPGARGLRVARRWLSVLAERYYQLTHDIIRRHDRRALFLGDRYQSFYYPEVARAAAKYVDVVSTNLNQHWNDGTFASFYLGTLHALTDKPILVSEFYMAAADNRSGNRNSHGMFPLVTTQPARAAAYRTTMLELLKRPYVVGADWFQYYDEPTAGRPDGEDWNFGLVDIHDRPYDELVTALRAIDHAQIKSQAVALKASGEAEGSADDRVGVPRAPSRPASDFRPGTALRDWDRTRGLVPPNSPAPLADLYVSWAPENLYLGLYAMDVVEPSFYRDGQVPEQDRMQWHVRIGTTRLQIRLGGGRDAQGHPQNVDVQSLSGWDLGVRTICIVRIPAQSLGVTRLEAARTLRLSSRLAFFDPSQRVRWDRTLVMD